MGELHEAGVTLGRLLGDRARELSHFAELKRWYLTTDMPSLRQFCATQRRAQQASELRLASPEDLAATTAASATGLRLADAATTVDRMLAGGHLSLDERAQSALQILAEHTRASSGLLFLLEADTPRLVASLRADSLLTAELQDWLSARLERERADEDTQHVELDQVESSSNVFEQPPWFYRGLLLLAPRAHQHGVLGMVVVASNLNTPEPCAVEVLSAVSYHLQRAREHQGTTSSDAPGV